MAELIFEILASINGVMGIGYWIADHDDIMHWLFFLILCVIMYINAARYGKGEE
jgi:hypothetical protein